VNRRNFIKTGLISLIGSLVPLSLFAFKEEPVKVMYTNMPINGLSETRIFVWTKNGIVHRTRHKIVHHLTQIPQKAPNEMWIDHLERHTGTRNIDLIPMAPGPKGILKLKGEVSEAQLKLIREQWRAQKIS